MRHWEREAWGTPTDFDRLKGQVEGQEEPGEWLKKLEKEALHEEWDREWEDESRAAPERMIKKE